MGDSAKQEASQDYYDEIKSYKPKFGYEDKVGMIDKLYQEYQNQINRESATDEIDATRGVAARAASQGITGGSILNNSVLGAKLGVNKNKFNALSKLKSSRLGLEPGLMDTENQNDLTRLSLEGGAISGLNDDTWFDDVLAVGNTASKFLPK